MLRTVALCAHAYLVKFNSSDTVANYMQQLQLKTSTCYSYVDRHFSAFYYISVDT